MSVPADIFEAGFVPAEYYSFYDECIRSVAAVIFEARFVSAGITEDGETDKTNTACFFIDWHVLHTDIVVHLFYLVKVIVAGGYFTDVSCKQQKDGHHRCCPEHIRR